jgi:hypothetical protein
MWLAWGIRNAYQILEKNRNKILIWRASCRWACNIKMDDKVYGSVQGPCGTGRFPVSASCEHKFRNPQNEGKFLNTLWDFKFSRRRVWSSELSSGMYCRVKQLSTDVSEVRAASIKHPRWWRQHVPLKRRSKIILHDSTSRKTILNFLRLVSMKWVSAEWMLTLPVQWYWTFFMRIDESCL